MLSRNNRQRNCRRRKRRMLRFILTTANIDQNSILRINSNTINRFARIITPQISNNSFENDFFNGTSFREDESLESLEILMLPAGCSVSSLFP